MSRSTRTRRASIAMALAIWSQACAVHRPIPPDGSIRPGSSVRIRSATPLGITRQTDSLPTMTVCCTTTVEGKLLRIAGDHYHPRPGIARCGYVQLEPHLRTAGDPGSRANAWNRGDGPTDRSWPHDGAHPRHRSRTGGTGCAGSKPDRLRVSRKRRWSILPRPGHRAVSILLQLMPLCAH